MTVENEELDEATLFEQTTSDEPVQAQVEPEIAEQSRDADGEVCESRRTKNRRTG